MLVLQKRVQIHMLSMSLLIKKKCAEVFVLITRVVILELDNE